MQPLILKIRAAYVSMAFIQHCIFTPNLEVAQSILNSPAYRLVMEETELFATETIVLKNVPLFQTAQIGDTCWSKWWQNFPLRCHLQLKGNVGDSNSSLQAAPDMTAETSQTSDSEKPEHRTTDMSLHPNNSENNSGQTTADPQSVYTQQLTETEKRSAAAHQMHATCVDVILF